MIEGRGRGRGRDTSLLSVLHVVGCRATQLQAEGNLLWSPSQVQGIMNMIRHLASGILQHLLLDALSSEASGSLGIVPWALDCCAKMIEGLIRQVDRLADFNLWSLLVNALAMWGRAVARASLVLAHLRPVNARQGILIACSLCLVPPG